MNFSDDIIVYGKSKIEHDRNLELALKALKEWNVALNWEKCIIGVEELDFLGHHLTSRGICTSKSKLEAIKKLREPRTVEEVRSLLGMVTYLGCYIPDLATITDPLRQLLKKDASFDWTKECSEAFTKIKENLNSERFLGYFDVRDRTQLYADASPVGLGAILIQLSKRGDAWIPRVITCASKSLTETEKRYCQTEKEALALVWGTERFHPYLFGIEFELITDHEALVTIFGPRSKPCARIERWVLRLLSYRYKVVYKKGKDNIADVFSRLCQDNEMAVPYDAEMELYVSTIVEAFRPVAIQLIEIQNASQVDNEIVGVKQSMNTGQWPSELTLYQKIKDELCFSGDILLRGMRIVIPNELRLRTVQLAHEGHPGITLTKQRLRSKVWWPKLDKMAEEFVRNCRSCVLVSAPSAPEPLRVTEMPSQPWQHIAIDFLGPLPSGENLLVIVDYYSRYIEVEIMRSIESSEVIKRLRTIFARLGRPISITMDNGRQLVSDEFQKFCREYNIQKVYTTPYWPQQNGEVERQNRSILKRLQISQAEKRDWKQDLDDYLLMYRTTPHSTTGKAPSDFVIAFPIKDKFPEIEHPLEANSHDEEARENDALRKEKSKEYADHRRRAKSSDLQIGDKVFVKNMMKTNKLTPTFGGKEYEVIERSGAEIKVQDSEGCVYRRNVAHAKRVPAGIGLSMKEKEKKRGG